jgi:hypothetical protein
MARPQAVKLGPFVGGLNLLADKQNIDNSELAECINLEVDLDGSLMNRPAITETANNGSNGSGRWKIIGRANFNAGGTYLILSNNDNGGVCWFDGTSFGYITSAQSEVAVQYNNIVYIIATQSSVTNSGRWDGTTYTADATMPRGDSALFHKSRLFVVAGPNSTTNTSRITFSDTITAVVLTWNAANIIDVSPGDGENLVDLVVYNDNLLLFKENSIYLLAYDIAPADAVLRKINGNIGVATLQSVEVYDNSIFFIHKGNVWEMQNYEFVKVNLKVPFVLDQTPRYPWETNKDPEWVRRVGDRLLVGFYNKRYSYHLLTRTWSEWQVDNNWAQMFGAPMALTVDNNTNEPVKYYMATVLSSSDSFYYMTDKYIPGTQDYMIVDNAGNQTPKNVPIICAVKTKELDFDIPFVWKRLMWWGIHATTGTVINSYVIANNVTQSNNTWQDLMLYSWNNLEGTWDNVLNQFEVTSVTQGSAVLGGKFYKFLRSLRFRTLSFRIVIKNDGTTTDGPVRLFSLTATVGYKQVVAKDKN